METERASSLWWRHALIPIAAFLVLAPLFVLSPLDERLARLLFHDGSRWIGAESWWTNDFLHVGGRWAMRLVGITALGAWLVGRISPRHSSLRRPAGYVALAFILSTGLVGLLKSATNVDCPCDLEGFGGDRPHVGLFEDRPDDLPRAACFPAAHSSSGFALFAFYFLWRERSRRLSLLGAGLGLIVGISFGLGQQSRGSHFLSHDIWSAFLVWMICLSLYAWAYGGRVFDCRTAGEPGSGP